MPWATATTISNKSSSSAQIYTLPGNWSVIHVPAVNVQATASKTAGATGVVHICTGIFATLVANSTAPVSVQITLNLIDGVSAGTTYLFREQFALEAVAGDRMQVNVSGLSLPGSAATAMTLEFSAAGGANTFESVTLTGYDATL